MIEDLETINKNKRIHKLQNEIWLWKEVIYHLEHETQEINLNKDDIKIFEKAIEENRKKLSDLGVIL